MTTIGPVQQIVATIRAEMGARIAAGVAPKRAGTSAGTGTAAARKRSSALVAERVRALDPLDPDRGRKAFRIFLESVLLAELGEELINDPAFYTMVDQVQRTMEASPEIEAAMATAVARLLEPARSR